MNAKTNNIKQAEIASIIAIGVSLFLVSLKGAIGFTTNSSVLLGDALHSGIDLVIIFTTWAGLRISQRKPTARFPYGYYKAESLATLFISAFILYASYELGIEGYRRLFEISQVKLPLLAIVVSVISILVSIIISRYLNRTGSRLSTQSLIVNGRERFMDAITSIAVLFAIIFNYYGIPYIEGIVTMLIALLVLWVGITSIKGSILALMDISPSKDIENQISDIIRKEKDIDAFKELKLRKAGPYVFGEVKIGLKSFIKVKKAHDIADKLEKKVKKFNRIDNFIVHIEPFKSKELKIAIPVVENKDLDSKIMEHFGRANHFMIIDVENKKIKEYGFLSNPFKKKEIRTGLAVAHYLIEKKINILVTREIGEISFHTLRDNLIDVYIAVDNNVNSIIEKLLSDKLQRLEKYTRKKD